ncbi:hypothetical protein [Methanobacterium oryzae]|uniref:hypothetical protein n=1 Tax=Methanobacterium oryzae TaxID=69540 RepID=UPI003D223749
MEEKSEREEIENKFQDIQYRIMKTVKDRKRSETDFLDTIIKQKKYWEDQLDNTDPEDKKDIMNLKRTLLEKKTLLNKLKRN